MKREHLFRWSNLITVRLIVTSGIESVTSSIRHLDEVYYIKKPDDVVQRVEKTIVNMVNSFHVSKMERVKIYYTLFLINLLGTEMNYKRVTS